MNTYSALTRVADAVNPSNAQKHAVHKKRLSENLTVLAKMADQHIQAVRAHALNVFFDGPYRSERCVAQAGSE
jgi:hypothetical protein